MLSDAIMHSKNIISDGMYYVEYLQSILIKHRDAIGVTFTYNTYTERHNFCFMQADFDEKSDVCSRKQGTCTRSTNLCPICFENSTKETQFEQLVPSTTTVQINKKFSTIMNSTCFNHIKHTDQRHFQKCQHQPQI